MALYGMKDPSRRLNDYLSRLDDSTLKRLVRQTGGQGLNYRLEMTAWIEQSLDNPARLKESLLKLRPYELGLLALLRDMGGECEDSVLRAAASGAGLPMPPSGNPTAAFHDILQHMLRGGFMLNWSDSNHLTRLQRTDYGIYTNLIFSDPRILEQAGPVEVAALDLPPSNSLAPTQARLPHLITMEIVALLQALERANGIGLTQSGVPRAVDLRKIAKAMNWPEGNLVDGPLVFENALPALISGLTQVRLLQPSPGGDRLLPGPAAREFTYLPIEQQVRTLLFGLIRASWSEEAGVYRNLSNYNPYAPGRAALFYLLSGLPAATRGPLYAIDVLDQALFDRIGSFFSIGGSYFKPAYYYTLMNNRSTNIEEVEKALHRDWLKTERKWLDWTLKTWLYFMGVIELAVDANGRLDALRLTDLGRAALHPELAVHAEAAPITLAGPAWVIQPNFDIVAYLDRLTTAQLAFLERHADRRSAQEHLAEYRLTRDSVYRGLEGGTRLDDLLAELERGAERPLPQNIAAELREWATQRERITLYRRASLAEFPSEAARELAIRAGLTGTRVGECFILLTNNPNRPLVRIFKHTINYDQSPQRNLLISEDGVVSYNHPIPDMLLDSRLAAWSEPHPSGGRVFTRQSVQAAVAAGRSVASLLKLIDERQYKLLPPLVRLSLRAWGGEKFSTALEQVVILRSSSSELTYALQQSDLLRPFLISTITSGIFLVKKDKIEELHALLKNLGFENGLV